MAVYMALRDCPEYSDFQKSKSSTKLVKKTLQLVPKELQLHVGPFLGRILIKMNLKLLAIERLFRILKVKEINATLPLDGPNRLHCPPPYQPPANLPSRHLSEALTVPDEETCLELQSVVEQNSAVLGESCVNSAIELLNNFKDICTRLKELEARLKELGGTAERQEEESEAEKHVRTELENLVLSLIRNPGVEPN